MSANVTSLRFATAVATGLLLAGCATSAPAPEQPVKTTVQSSAPLLPSVLLRLLHTFYVLALLGPSQAAETAEAAAATAGDR